MVTRRQFLSGCAALGAAAIAGSTARPCERSPLPLRIEAALDRASDFLIAQQSADGAWRSKTYGPLKDGPSLTGFIAASMSRVDTRSGRLQKSLSSARDYLTRIANDDLDVASDVQISYPVYAAAGAVIALSGRCNVKERAARDVWLRHLRRQQLNETLGWKRKDESFGGWSFAHTPSVAIDGQSPSPLATPNLSATAFALEALHRAGCPSDDQAIQDALVFVQRCQNLSQAGSAQDTTFDDGGFFFVHGDATRNKAGEAGTDASGHLRYRSYGSTTADGLRSLLYCGLPSGHSRVQAAVLWLYANWAAAKHPGNYPPDREHLRHSLYFYFCASAADAIRMASDEALHPPSFAHAMANLAGRLIDLQHDDGAWTNSAVDVREDDPLVATPLAMRALSACR
jgi:hypothetical protein